MHVLKATGLGALIFGGIFGVGDAIYYAYGADGVEKALVIIVMGLLCYVVGAVILWEMS